MSESSTFTNSHSSQRSLHSISDTSVHGSNLSQREALDSCSESISEAGLSQNSKKRLKEGKRSAQKLRNLLRLPQAQRHIIYEFFYSDIDEQLFKEGNSDFLWCLNDMLPELASPTVRKNQLTKNHYRTIRRIFGRPRRFSEAFLNEERLTIHKTREKMRLIQQNNGIPVDRADSIYWEDVPKQVPMLLSVGTRVDAVLFASRESIPSVLLSSSDQSGGSSGILGVAKHVHTGIYSGTVAAVDLGSRSYRVTFDKSVLGTRSIPDTDLRAIKRNSDTLIDITNSSRSQETVTKNSRSKSSAPESPFMPLDSTMQGYSVKYLTAVHRMSEAVSEKQYLLKKLADMNNEAQTVLGEKYSTILEEGQSSARGLDSSFDERYTELILELTTLDEKVNALQQLLKPLPAETDSSEQLAVSAVVKSKESLPNNSNPIHATTETLITTLGGILHEYSRALRENPDLIENNIPPPSHEFKKSAVLKRKISALLENAKLDHPDSEKQSSSDPKIPDNYKKSDDIPSLHPVMAKISRLENELAGRQII